MNSRRFSRALAWAAAGILSSSCTASPAKSAVSACEEVLSTQLQAPSTYKSLWTDFTQQGPITLQEVREKHERVIAKMQNRFSQLSLDERITLAYMKTQPEAKPERNYEERGFARQPNTGFVLLEYEAQNALGAPLRKYHFCRLSQPSDVEFSRRDVFLEGEVRTADGDKAKELYEAANR